ncbi:M56 family metallopeptidase [Kordiimonas laminariae]|uniref:M56 family metallopeptidase n=1 Tax=Kordiimonas laminariae TaxID=2917717 RepID=UPI001FF5B32F|nr:M56 family metallopeptidase [Kordiimonas laminariae]MCK0070844.1 ankyrin repeat domain-containing protein [Kordiimonas laminariae]
MLNSALETLISFSVVLSVAILLVLMLRKQVRQHLGASAGYMVWVAVPFSLLIYFLPFAALFIEQQAASQPIYAAFLLEEVVPIPVATSNIQQTVSSFFPSGIATPAITLWVLGFVLSAAIFVIRQRRLKTLLSPIKNSGKGYYQSNTEAVGPALIGLIKPKIIVPPHFETQYSSEEQRLILTHERVHQKHKDPLVNGITALLQLINWFNPLIHYAAGKLFIDQELACDAAVLRQFPEARKRYANTLLHAHRELVPNALNCFWSGREKHPFVERIQAIQLEALNGPKKANNLLALGTISIVTLAAVLPDWNKQLRQITPSIATFASTDQLALISAAQKGDTIEAAKLLKSGVNPNISISPYGTPLIIAASRGDTKMAETLMAHGAKADLSARGKGFPLLSAVEREDIALVAQLLKNGATINALVPEMDASPLATAAKIANPDMVSLLLAHKADPNMPVDDEGSALIAAVSSGKLEIVEMLVRAGANTKAVGRLEESNHQERHTTALKEAKRQKRNDIERYLIQLE